MQKVYASSWDWDRIELLSSGIREVWSASLANIIKELNPPSHILDLGCGTGYFSAEMLSKLGSHHLYYTGVDLDAQALLRAKSRIKSQSSFLNESALGTPVTLLARSAADVIISLSNTFLCLGSRTELVNFLNSIRRSEGQKHLVFSVVPWGPFQQLYNKMFVDWYYLQSTSRDCWVKMDIIEHTEHIKQHVYIKDSDEPSQITHRFLKMNVPEITAFFVESGWQIRSWRSPIDGSVVDPETAQLPEFFIICDQISRP